MKYYCSIITVRYACRLLFGYKVSLLCRFMLKLTTVKVGGSVRRRFFIRDPFYQRKFAFYYSDSGLTVHPIEMILGLFHFIAILGHF